MATLDEIRNDSARAINYILAGSVPRWHGLGKMHMEWHYAVDRVKDNIHAAREGLVNVRNVRTGIMIESPRDHAKTTNMAIGRVLYELGSNPNVRIKLVCSNDKNATKRVLAIQSNIDNNQNLHKLFPDLRAAKNGGVWSATQLTVERDAILVDPSVEACGVLSSGTGGRADIIIFDDIVDERNAILFPKMREQVKSAYRNTWLNLVEDDGFVIYISTSWHSDDLTSELLREEDPMYIIMRYLINDNFDPVWEEKWSRDKLIKRYHEIGATAFNRGYRGRTTTDDEVLISESLYDEHSIFYSPETDIPKDSVICFGVDLGHRTSRKSPRTAIVGLALTPSGKKMPILVKSGAFTSPETAEILFDLYLSYFPKLIFVENNGYQQALLDWMSAANCGVPLPVQGRFTGANKNSLETGIPGLAVEVTTGRWVFPQLTHDVECSCDWCVWKREIISYPCGKFSDLMMATWLASEALNYLSLRGEELTMLNIRGLGGGYTNYVRNICEENIKEKLNSVDRLTKLLAIDEDD